MTDLPDPSLPLRNKRHEMFALQRAKGVDQGAAWKNTIPFGQAYNGGANSLRVSGHRVEKRLDVKARIRMLIAEARSDASEVPDTFERGDIIKLTLEVSEGLQNAYEAALEANVSPLRLEQLRTVFASHLARQGKMTEEADEAIPDDAAAARVRKMAEWMHDVGECQCQKR